MKKIIKITALILIISVIGILLCGCNGLDKMKASQAFFTKDGKIVYGNTEYLPLPESEELLPLTDNEFEYIYVTAEDVPVLLSQFLCEEYQLCGGGKFLASAYGETNYYCRSDVYTSVTEQIENGFIPECYSYCYFDFDTDATKYYRLSEEQKSAIDTVISSVSPEIIPKIAEITSDYSVIINACSNDMVFSKYACDLYLNGDDYYITRPSENDSNLLMYPVPESMSDIFGGIMKEFINSESYWLEY